MNKLVLVLLFLPCCFANALSENTKFEKENYVYARLLLSDTNASLKAVTRTLFDLSVKDSDLLDLVAEVLVESLGNRRSLAERSDTIAWLVKVLGQSGSKRYEPIVKSVLSFDIGNERFSSHIDRALAKLLDGSDESFISTPGLLEVLRTRISNTASKSDNLAHNFSMIDVGAGLAQVVELVGEPDEIVLNRSRVVNIGVAYIKATAMQLKYFDQGVVYLSYKKGKNIGWSTDITSNAYLLTANEPDKEVVSLAETILSDDWVQINKVLKRILAEKKMYPNIIYDISMEKVLRFSKAKAYREEKMLANMLRLVISSKNARYKDSVALASKISRSNLIRRLSQHGVRNLKLQIDDEDHYVRGSVDIGNQTVGALSRSKKMMEKSRSYH